ncbi:major facilitator superfamily transporter [Zopfia rhizophila CBS 207.26]|uniref:Major facilitator superfamily transporter n=1 Tax=Zopfia rhizophila CBS 207.26 TaxID=1314779 RepID=A0A6A6DEP9_9PEZI|nr:major facilitator superfamily transporter [Zopfia rhizophila CBS 207.26]
MSLEFISCVFVPQDSLFHSIPYASPSCSLLGAPHAEKRFSFQRAKACDPDAIATLHKLIRKIDIRVMIFACIMFMALEHDCANILQVNTENFLKNLHLTSNDYNLGNTIFKLSFLCVELLSQFVNKWMGPDRWIPIRASLLTCRSLLGILQGVFIPDIILYLSYFYKHRELSFHLGFFWTAMGIADILAGFLAYALLHMKGLGDMQDGGDCFLSKHLSDGKLGMREKGWFTAREEGIMVNRITRDDPSKGSMHNRQSVTPKLLWESLKDYDLWPLYILGLLFQIQMTSPQQYLTLSLRGRGFDTFQSNLLAVSWTLIHIILMLTLAYFAEINQELTAHSMTGEIWAIPFLLWLVVTGLAKAKKWKIWAIITLPLSYPNGHPIQVGWNSRNSNTVRSRTVSAACYNMFVQASSAISSNIYRKDDAPNYTRSNETLLGIAPGNFGVYFLAKTYYIWRNKQRGKIWNVMTEQDKLEYLETTTDEGNKRLGFMFAY